jgi:hypothetical protein
MREEGAPLGEVFTFLSGLYFRGKLEYARRFASEEAGGAIHIITMTDGLMSPDRIISTADLDRFAQCEEGSVASRQTLEQSARAVRDACSPHADVVLLGSVGTGKYADVLLPIFGDRLLFPRDILHIGQLARGALFLRHAREGNELEYHAVSEIERAGRRASLRQETAARPLADIETETPRPATRPNTEDARASPPR